MDSDILTELTPPGLKQPLTDFSDKEKGKRKKDSTVNKVMELWERRDEVRARQERGESGG